MLRLVADSHCRKSNESRQRRAREEELVWEGEQLVARKSANLAVKVVSLIQKQKFQVCKALSRCKAVVNAASIEFYDDAEKDSKDEEQKEKSDDQELYESLRALLERARATVIRLTDERDRLEGVSMKAAQSALRDARSTVEQLRKEEEAREIEEELLQAELTALVVRYLYLLSLSSRKKKHTHDREYNRYSIVRQQRNVLQLRNFCPDIELVSCVWRVHWNEVRNNKLNVCDDSNEEHQLERNAYRRVVLDLTQ